MANRPRGYGLSAELHSKMMAKYDENKECEARDWVVAVVGEPLANDQLGSKFFHEALKDGVYLCKLANKITGQVSIRYNESKMAFKQMENISKFLQFCEKYGLAKTDLFQTVDLFEAQNMWSVVLTIFALGRKAQANGFDGPQLGPKEATQNRREFSPETLQAGQQVIGLQMGSNKGASQAGMSFGTTRHIADIPVDAGTKAGQGIIGLQMGTNQVASQAGMSFGRTRHIADFLPEESKKYADDNANSTTNSDEVVQI